MADQTLRLPTGPVPARGSRSGGRGSGGRGSSGRSGGSGRGRRRSRRAALTLTLLVAFLLVALVGAWAWWNGSVGPVAVREHCTSTATGKTAELDPEQAGNAAVITAIAGRRGLPARAATIGIATAIQESKLRNIDYGDRDSLGLFQQRPSQGWGSREEVTDPVYASNKFYEVLAEVDGYETMEITKVAQRVQRSAFPEAYADHEPEARVIASALSGYSPGGFSCVLRPHDAADAADAADAENAETGEAGSNGEASTGPTTSRARAEALTAAAESETGRTEVRAEGAGGASLRFTVPSQDGPRDAWALAHWAVARADGLEVVRVDVADRRWDRDDSTDGWTAREQALPAGVVVVSVA